MLSTSGTSVSGEPESGNPYKRSKHNLYECLLCKVSTRYATYKSNKTVYSSDIINSMMKKRKKDTHKQVTLHTNQKVDQQKDVCFLRAPCQKFGFPRSRVQFGWYLGLILVRMIRFHTGYTLLSCPAQRRQRKKEPSKLDALRVPIQLANRFGRFKRCAAVFVVTFHH